MMCTKIYGTIGPACHDTDTLVRLFEKGMTGIRINLSHSDLSACSEWIKNIKFAYKKTGRCKADNANKTKPEILMDLCGPELRLGRLRIERELRAGDMLTLVAEGRNNLFDPTELPVPEPVLPHLASGQQILVDDGMILLEAEELFRDRTGYAAECKVVRAGVLKSGKSIALPGITIESPTLTESDLENIRLAKEYGITGVMLPFVRNQDDLRNLKQALIDADAGDIRIFAKIENMDGVKRLPELLPYCDEIVIARGDLGNAMPLWELPVVQEQIATACREMGKPFMVVTQMLASMERTAVPTRAEVSDIFRATQQGAASVMLTGETAAGEHPVEAMEYMVNTVRAAEGYLNRLTGK